MMISRISGYAPIRQAQNVNFGAIKVDDWVKENCRLTDEDISKLNARCPNNLDVDVSDFGTDGYHREVCRAKVSYKGKYCNYCEDFDVYTHESDENRAKKRSKENFMSCMNKVLNLNCKGYTKQDEGRINQELNDLQQKWNILMSKNDIQSCNELLVNARRQNYLKNILTEIQTTGSAARVIEKYPYSPCGSK